jgi:hypothetical protein
VSDNEHAEHLARAFDPHSAEQEFERWRDSKHRNLEREQGDFVTAWAKVAWLANAHRAMMGREIAKLQSRIHRQRVANRENLSALEASEQENRELRESLRYLTKAADNTSQPDYVQHAIDMAQEVLSGSSEISALEASEQQNVRLRRKVASLEREQVRLWTLINAAEEG